MKTALQLIDDIDLARLIISRLWVSYDLGGISNRRNPLSTLLESFMELYPAKIHHLDIYSEQEMLGEVASRVILKTQEEKQTMIQSELRLGLRGVSNIELSYHLSRQMMRIYEKTDDWPVYQRRLLDALICLCPLILGRTIYATRVSTEKILREACERQRVKLERESYRFQIENGIVNWL